jgi:hypothetical protein
MTTTKWAHLPNAAHIDRVIAAAKANPSYWRSQIVNYTGWNAAWDAAEAAMAEKQGRKAIWQAVLSAAQNDSLWSGLSGVVLQPMLALFAFDDCAHMLDSDPGELAILAAFGDPRAVLILPACKIFNIKEETECQ